MKTKLRSRNNFCIRKPGNDLFLKILFGLLFEIFDKNSGTIFIYLSAYSCWGGEMYLIPVCFLQILLYEVPNTSFLTYQNIIKNKFCIVHCKFYIVHYPTGFT